jgi:hypothetical protein
MAKCQFPGCKKKATKTWAMVNLCKEHHEDIVEETRKFYNSTGFAYDDRVSYHKIKDLTPWGEDGTK